MTQYKQILTDGLWTQNPGLIQFLGICPLLAVSNSLVNGLGLGLATLFVLIGSNFIVALLRPVLNRDVRLPIFVLIIATLVTLVELVAEAWFFDLWLSLGIFLPLIVTNCVILARAESFASRQPVSAAVVDGIAHGLGFAAVLILLGGMRELIGNGTLFAGAEMLFGPAATGMELRFYDGGFLLALLPPGAFLGLALLVAVRNIIEQRSSSADSRSDVTTDTA
ncbi:MAG: electron transport complex subunit E [Gammaproteobacteria bacterium]|nr:electron transport complex subunit E [Gammaproteobacteria bacterium]